MSVVENHLIWFIRDPPECICERSTKLFGVSLTLSIVFLRRLVVRLRKCKWIFRKALWACCCTIHDFAHLVQFSALSFPLLRPKDDSSKPTVIFISAIRSEQLRKCCLFSTFSSWLTTTDYTPVSSEELMSGWCVHLLRPLGTLDFTFHIFVQVVQSIT